MPASRLQPPLCSRSTCMRHVLPARWRSGCVNLGQSVHRVCAQFTAPTPPPFLPPTISPTPLARHPRRRPRGMGHRPAPPAAVPQGCRVLPRPRLQCPVLAPGAGPATPGPPHACGCLLVAVLWWPGTLCAGRVASWIVPPPRALRLAPSDKRQASFALVQRIRRLECTSRHAPNTWWYRDGFCAHSPFISAGNTRKFA
jgi:hypothetical protein